jgi:glycosyltransferase
LVLDGGSTDGTFQILQKYGNYIHCLVSEPDNGIYDALNKGIAKASGDIIGFLHSDDFFANSNVLLNLVDQFKRFNLDAVYGDLQYVRRDDPAKVVRYWKSGVFKKSNLALGWMPPHPTFYALRSVYQRLGNFDTTFRIAADYDCMLRFLNQDNFRVGYIPEVLVKMRVGGESNRSLRNILRKTREDYRILQRHCLGGMAAVAWKNLSKVGQFFTA